MFASIYLYIYLYMCIYLCANIYLYLHISYVCSTGFFGADHEVLTRARSEEVANWFQMKGVKAGTPWIPTFSIGHVVGLYNVRPPVVM
jgi:hypothetical protein